MPEFVLNVGDREGAQAFAALDDFTQGVVECLFFTAPNGDGGEEEEDLTQASVEELSPDTLADIKRECAAFLADAGPILESLEGRDDFRRAHTRDASLMTVAGHDFVYSRNHHGCGFEDGDWPKAEGDRLNAIARRFRERNLYRGDDGALYLD